MNGMQDMFTRIAGMYDRLNHVLTCGLDTVWRRRAVARLAAPARVLDLACGTGDFTRAVARRFPSAALTGLDLTPAMLARARGKLPPSCTLMEGDAQNLPFGADAFDAVVCAFGFRNFPEPAKALAEAARVLRAGGELLVLELFRPRSRARDAVVTGWLRFVSAVCARSARGDYAYLRASISHTVSEEDFVRMAADAGFALKRSAFYRPACSCLHFAKCDKMTP